MENLRKHIREESKAVCADLNEYLMSEFGCKTPPVRFPIGNSILAHRRAFNIYLYHKPTEAAGWGKNTLVIVSIEFQKQRAGNGSSFLRFLVRISDKYGYERIGIECATNEKIVGFARKYGFEHHGREGNWIASVGNLKKMLERSPGDCQI
jgi:hypothetical protein